MQYALIDTIILYMLKYVYVMYNSNKINSKRMLRYSALKALFFKIHCMTNIHFVYFDVEERGLNMTSLPEDLNINTTCITNMKSHSASTDAATLTVGYYL